MGDIDLDPVVLSDEQFERLAQYGQEEQAEAGRILYASYDLFLLRTATVQGIRNATAVEPEQVIYRRGPGCFLVS